MKEELVRLFTIRAEDSAREGWTAWFKGAKENGIPALVRFAELKEKRLEGLIAHAAYPISTGKQVGKTWLMKEFGQTCYESFVYFNFDEEDALKSIFGTNKNPQRIIELLSLIAGEKILPGKTLIIFDEVQECPEALNALKYFKEKANNYHIIAVRLVWSI